MNIEIEVYKGQTIQYNEDADKFLCDISIEDRFKTTKRQSLKDVRKEIDSFIKINAEFKPFKVFKKDTWGDITALNITGIRSDGKFLLERSGNYTSQETMKKLVEDYAQYDSSIEQEAIAARKAFDEADKIYNEKKKELRKRMKNLDLSKYEHLIQKSQSPAVGQ